MKTLLLSAAVLSTLAAPAFAGRLDDADPSVRATYGASEANVDYSATRSIQATGSVSGATRNDADNQSSIQRGEQGAYFGANGH